MENSTARLQWPDVAKGVCILLVVLHHVTGKQYAAVVPTGLGPAEDAWIWLTGALKPIRMPLFFAVSGFFAASSIGRPWPEVRKRIANPYYLYVVWLVVFAGIYSVERTLPANRTDGVADFLGELVWAATSMWFLFALAAYFALAKALRGLPAPLVLTAAAVVAVSTSWLPLDEANRVAVLAHFGYFAFGAYYPRVFRRLAGLRLPLQGMLAAYAGLLVGLELADAPRSVALLVLSLVGVPMGVAAAARVSGTAIARPLAWLGRRTLPVYVLHMAVLAVVAHLPIGLDTGWGPGTALLTVVYPAVLTGLITVTCLGMHRLLLRRGCGFLFAAPTALLDAVRFLDHDPSRDPARRSRHRGAGRAGADGGVERQRARGRRVRGRRPGVVAHRDADGRPGPHRGGRNPGGTRSVRRRAVRAGRGTAAAGGELSLRSAGLVAGGEGAGDRRPGPLVGDHRGGGAVVAAAAVLVVARRRLGGVTGDVLGAGVELALAGYLVSQVVVIGDRPSGG